MIESKTMVPKVYSDSRDYRALLKILDLLIFCIKIDTDNFVNLLNPMKCPANMLPLLASYVGYDYDYNESVYANRLIIKYYPYMIRNRGSETGIKLAVSLAINASNKFNDINLLTLFSVDYDYEEGKIKIYMHSRDYINKIKDLIEVVRPAGTGWEIVLAEPINSIETISLADTIDFTTYNYVTGDIDKLGKNRYSITFDQDGHISNISEDGFILDENNNPTIYKIVNIEYEVKYSYTKDEDGNEVEEKIVTDKVSKIMIKNTLSGNVTWAHTDRYKIGDKNRIGFGEVSGSERG